MRKRGRPPHPDILTPREWQVLDLVREGLSNERIAQRLDIGLAGAKYHVSEILTKLGVATREEAAAWQPEAVTVAWWRRGLAPLTLAKAAGMAGAAVALTGLALLAWGVWRTGDGDGGIGDLVPATDITLADVYSRVREVISREGMVVHVTERAPSSGESTAEYWIDPTREVARIVHPAVKTHRSVTIYAGGRYYYISGGGDSSIPGDDLSTPVAGPGPRCRDVSGVTALLIEYTYSNCPESTEVLAGTYEGRPVIAVKNHWVYTNEDGDRTGEATSWTYFDSETYLPIGRDRRTASPYFGVSSGGGNAIETEFLAASSFPDDFFNIDSTGYRTACAEYRLRFGPACYLPIFLPEGQPPESQDLDFVIDEVIRLGVSTSTDAADRSSATATMMTAGEALDLIVTTADGQPGFEPQGLTQLLDPLDQEVWIIKVRGFFAFRGGPLYRDGVLVPTPVVFRGTLLAAVSVDGGAIIYSNVAYD